MQGDVSHVWIYLYGEDSIAASTCNIVDHIQEDCHSSVPLTTASANEFQCCMIHCDYFQTSSE